MEGDVIIFSKSFKEAWRFVLVKKSVENRPFSDIILAPLNWSIDYYDKNKDIFQQTMYLRANDNIFSFPLTQQLIPKFKLFWEWHRSDRRGKKLDGGLDYPKKRQKDDNNGRS